MFEQYIIEKTKNERLIANLDRRKVYKGLMCFIVGIKVDFEELYKNVPQPAQSVPMSNLNSASKNAPINIMI